MIYHQIKPSIIPHSSTSSMFWKHTLCQRGEIILFSRLRRSSWWYWCCRLRFVFRRDGHTIHRHWRNLTEAIKAATKNMRTLSIHLWRVYESKLFYLPEKCSILFFFIGLFFFNPRNRELRSTISRVRPPASKLGTGRHREFTHLMNRTQSYYLQLYRRLNFLWVNKW